MAGYHEMAWHVTWFTKTHVANRLPPVHSETLRKRRKLVIVKKPLTLLWYLLISFIIIISDVLNDLKKHLYSIKNDKLIE